MVASVLKFIRHRCRLNPGTALQVANLELRLNAAGASFTLIIVVKIRECPRGGSACRPGKSDPDRPGPVLNRQGGDLTPQAGTQTTHTAAP